MSKKTMSKIEIGFLVFLIMLSVIVFRDTLSLPPGSFDPVGSAGFPRVISIIIGILSLIILIHPTRSSVNDLQKASKLPTHRRRGDLAFGFYVLAFFYVLSLAFNLASFAICTSLFLIITMGMLTGFDRKRLLLVVFIALVIGFGSQYLFTKVFVVDLP